MPETIVEQQTEIDLKSLAQDIVSRAMSSGASTAECVVREGDEFSTLVRLGQVETLKESGSKAIGVRVFCGKRSASTYSSDFSRDGLDRMLNGALALAKEATSIFTLLTYIRCLDRNASRMRVAPRKRRSIPTRASRTPMADRSTLPLVTKFSPIHTASSASIGGPIVLWLPFQSLKMTREPCSAITGSRSAGASSCSNLQSRSAKLLPSARYGGSAHGR